MRIVNVEPLFNTVSEVPAGAVFSNNGMHFIKVANSLKGVALSNGQEYTFLAHHTAVTYDDAAVFLTYGKEK